MTSWQDRNTYVIATGFLAKSTAIRASALHSASRILNTRPAT